MLWPADTCFFNSVLQCLAATPPLLSTLAASPPSTLPLHTQLSLALQSLNSSSSSSSFSAAAKAKRRSSASDTSTFTPSALLTEVRRGNAVFKGNRQQDAHELLRWLLSAAAGEEELVERRRRRDAIVEQLQAWDRDDVQRLVQLMGLRSPAAQQQLMRGLEAVAEAGSSGGAGEVSGRLVLQLLERWETKEGRRWRKLMTDGLQDKADKKQVEATFARMRTGSIPPVKPSQHSGAEVEQQPAEEKDERQQDDDEEDDRDDDDEEEEEEEGRRRSHSQRAVLGSGYVHRVFGGVLENVVECSCCHAVTRTQETFFDLSLPIEPPRPPPAAQPKAAVKAERQHKAAAKEKPAQRKEREAEEKQAEEASAEKRRQAEELKQQREEEERRHLLLVEEMSRADVRVPVTLRRKRQAPRTVGRGKAKARLSTAQRKITKRKMLKGKKSRKDGEEEEAEEETEEAAAAAELEGEEDEEKEERDGSESEEKAEAEADVSPQRLLRADEKGKEESAEEQKRRAIGLSPDELGKHITKELGAVLVRLGMGEEEVRGLSTYERMDAMMTLKHQAREAESRKAAEGEEKDTRDSSVTVEEKAGGFDPPLAQVQEEEEELKDELKEEQKVQEAEAVQDIEQGMQQLSVSESPSRALSPSPAVPAAAVSGPSRLSGSCSVDDCLACFFDRERLTGANQFRCSSCSALAALVAPSSSSSSSSAPLKRDAERRSLIRTLPAVLTVHLKRFAASASGRTLEKSNKLVSFPAQLDLLPYTEGGEERRSRGDSQHGQYELYGLVSHSGGMGGGHYVSYVCRAGAWWQASDSHVRPVTQQEALRAQAYILFYLHRSMSCQYTQ